jgi:hypothetical protein
VLDGFPGDHAIGCDLLPRFLELGHKLYDDKDTCQINFIDDNIINFRDAPQNFYSNPQMALSSTPSTIEPCRVTKLMDLLGRVRYLFTSAVFHLFNEEIQTALAHRLALLVIRTRGSIIFGRHLAGPERGWIDSTWSR